MKTVTTISALHDDEEKWMGVFIHTMMTTTTFICIIILYISLIIQYLLVWQLLSITLDLSSKDESESGQMVSEKVNELYLMYIFNKQCEIMAKIQWNSSNYQLHCTDFTLIFCGNGPLWIKTMQTQTRFSLS